jgi:short chain dehydrogenase
MSTGTDTVSGRFAGKTAIVTGAGSGIGRATVLRLAREGATVVAAGISETRLNELTAQNPGPALIPVTADVATAEGVAAVVASTSGRVDALANVAGIMDGLHAPGRPLPRRQPNPRRPDSRLGQDLPPGPRLHCSHHQRPVRPARSAKPDPARASALSPPPVIAAVDGVPAGPLGRVAERETTVLTPCQAGRQVPALELNPAGRLGLDPPVRHQLNGHPTDRSAY